MPSRFPLRLCEFCGKAALKRVGCIHIGALTICTCASCWLIYLSFGTAVLTTGYYVLDEQQSGPGEYDLVASFSPSLLPLKIVAKSNGDFSIRPTSRFQTPFGTLRYEIQQDKGSPSVMVDGQKLELGDTEFKFLVPECLELDWNPEINILKIDLLGEYQKEFEKSLKESRSF